MVGKARPEDCNVGNFWNLIQLYLNHELATLWRLWIVHALFKSWSSRQQTAKKSVLLTDSQLLWCLALQQESDPAIPVFLIHQLMHSIGSAVRNSWFTPLSRKNHVTPCWSSPTLHNLAWINQKACPNLFSVHLSPAKKNQLLNILL